MTLDEAKKIAEIIRWADDGCPLCVGALVKRANEAFPEFIFTKGKREEGQYAPTVSVSLKESPISP